MSFKNLKNSASKLNKNEMGELKGGAVAKFHCQCDGVGTWEGSYSSALSVANAIDRWCENGGTCTAM